MLAWGGVGGGKGKRVLWEASKWCKGSWCVSLTSTALALIVVTVFLLQTRQWAVRFSAFFLFVFVREYYMTDDVENEERHRMREDGRGEGTRKG